MDRPKGAAESDRRWENEGQRKRIFVEIAVELSF